MSFSGKRVGDVERRGESYSWQALSMDWRAWIFAGVLSMRFMQMLMLWCPIFFVFDGSTSIWV